MPDTQSPTRWSQPSLMPIHWPLVELRLTVAIPADSTTAMVSWQVVGESDSPVVVARGIDWIRSVADHDQCAEVFLDLMRETLGHLSPF